jgi:hypothetical protein
MVTKPIGERVETTLLYFPPDDGFLNFSRINVAHTGYVFSGYVSGAPANTAVGRLRVKLNFECVPNQNVVDYIATSYYTGLPENIEEILMDIRRGDTRPIKQSRIAHHTPAVGYERWKTPSVTVEEYNENLNKIPIAISSPSEKTGFWDTVMSIYTKIIEPAVSTIVPVIAPLIKGQRSYEQALGIKPSITPIGTLYETAFGHKKNPIDELMKPSLPIVSKSVNQESYFYPSAPKTKLYTNQPGQYA